MRIIGIDPSPTGGAWVVVDETGKVIGSGSGSLGRLCDAVASRPCEVAIEMPAGYGMPVGVEVFETCATVGSLLQSAALNHAPAYRYYRKTVLATVCGSSRGNDATIRQALVDRYGPTRQLAVGTKKSPGPLYGLGNDERAALAVALTHLERRGDGAVDIGAELSRKRAARSEKAAKRKAKQAQGGEA